MIETCIGMRECFFRLVEHERASAMERAVWRRRIEEEDVVELLHVEAETKEREREGEICSVFITFWSLFFFNL